jgi:hypothetical protein
MNNTSQWNVNYKVIRTHSVDPPSYWDHCVRYLSIPMKNDPTEEAKRLYIKSYMEMCFAEIIAHIMKN